MIDIVNSAEIVSYQ